MTDLPRDFLLTCHTVAAAALAETTVEAIKGRSQVMGNVDARRQMFASAVDLGFSTTEIGIAFNRDRTSVISALKVAK